MESARWSGPQPTFPPGRADHVQPSSRDSAHIQSGEPRRTRYWYPSTPPCISVLELQKNEYCFPSVIARPKAMQALESALDDDRIATSLGAHQWGKTALARDYAQGCAIEPVTGLFPPCRSYPAGCRPAVAYGHCVSRPPIGFETGCGQVKIAPTHVRRLPGSRWPPLL